MWVYFVELFVLLSLSIFLIMYYSERQAAIYARILVGLSFSISFLCFMILPIDIYESTFQGSESIDLIKNIWVIVYYINFFLCWLILPFAQQYQDSGAFTIGGKLKEALIMNAILIGVLCIGAVAFVLYLVFASSFTISQLPAVFATLVNVFGLTLVSILLGYGLVSFPKQCFIRRDYKRKVNLCHKMAEVVKTQIQTIYQEIFIIRGVLDKDQSRDITQKRIIYTLIDSNFKLDNFRAYLEEQTDLTKKDNKSLHKIVKKRILEYNACQSQLDELVDDLKDITQSYLKNNYSHKKVYYTMLFIICSLVSVVIFFAELSTFIPWLESINLMSIIHFSPLTSYIVNTVMTVYIAYIVTNTIFRVKVYKTFSLHKNHSAAASLIFTSINLSRICYPLCYNYLQITNMPQSTFIDFFGDVSFNKQYTIIFPIIMIVFGLFNLFDIYDTIMGYLGFGSYAFDEEEALEKKEEGRNVLIERLKERNLENHQLEMIQLL